ncbi:MULTISPECIES: M23 family metallopeptidase [unclassified Paenibacillus]|uniref:M23 family metallopeptidase n=1 Tax=unclassified Paenibacillus TaxID=185978 RepID=UPI00030D2587|nr:MULTISPECIES: M23 family metallopeptidase [unclassified Paenibacillus]MCT2196070.1 M23 family metallopeptidase [Paenibacillus sp. p3-SID1389]
MDVKSNVKKRRAERIRQLTMEDAVGPLPPDQGWGSAPGRAAAPPRTKPWPVSAGQDDTDPDPELLWKRGQGRWQDPYAGAYGSGKGDDELMGPGPGKRSTFWFAMFVRLVISTLLFAAIWGMNRYEPAWATPIRAFIAKSLTVEMDFQAAQAWYERNFGGAPSFIPIFKTNEDHGLRVGGAAGFSLPIEGSLASPFALSLKGVEIIPDTGSLQVKAIETGRVLRVAREAETGQTVTVQHAGGYVSVYGHLEQISVEKGDWLEGGDVLGSLPPRTQSPLPTLYFAIKKDDRYIDPADVIPFD